MAIDLLLGLQEEEDVIPRNNQSFVLGTVFKRMP